MGWRRVSKQRHICRPLISKLAPNFAIHGGQAGIRAACARIFFLRSSRLNDKQERYCFDKNKSAAAVKKENKDTAAGLQFSFASSLTSSVD